MSRITLHRASRIVEAIQEALKTEPKTSGKISIFSENITLEITGRQAACIEAVETVRRLLEIRRNIKSAVDLENAKCGISPLLQAKYAQDDLLKVLKRMPGVGVEPRPETDDEMMFRRKPKKPSPPPLLDAKATLAMAEASKARFLAAEGDVTAEIEISTVDSEASKRFRQMAVEARRETDRVAEELRALNATHGIEISDEDLDWLTTHEVV